MGKSGSKHVYFDTAFWDDEWISSLELPEKTLYLYFLTNRLFNISGVYKITDRRICFDTTLKPKQIQKIMTKFQEMHKVYRMGEYIVIPDVPKMQVLDNEKIYSGVVNCLLEVEPVYLRQLVRMNYKFDLKVVFDRLGIPSKEVSIPPEWVSSPLPAKSQIDMVLEKSAELGFFIEANVAGRLVSSIDPSWIDGPHTFMKLAAERARGGRYSDLPDDEQKAIYLSALFKWNDLRQEYPKWRATLEAKDEKERIAREEAERRLQREEARKVNRPSVCQCGSELDEVLRCSACGGEYEFNETTWAYYFYPKGSKPDLMESFKKLVELKKIDHEEQGKERQK
jgi:hypothetical protein